jgi:hypothetical protein
MRPPASLSTVRGRARTLRDCKSVRLDCKSYIGGPGCAPRVAFAARGLGWFNGRMTLACARSRPSRPWPWLRWRPVAAVAVSIATLSAGEALAAPCDGSEYRQFDFWLGTWQVHTPDGKLAGTNRIEREYDGCVIHEHYTTGRGYTGESLNTYDAARKVWHQTWVDNGGTLLLLEGALRNGSMVLEGQTLDDQGRVTKHRITWTPNADGSVRQHWESTDENGRFTTAFDGKYTHE